MNRSVKFNQQQHKYDVFAFGYDALLQFLQKRSNAPLYSLQISKYNDQNVSPSSCASLYLACSLHGQLAASLLCKNLKNAIWPSRCCSHPWPEWPFSRSQFAYLPDQFLDSFVIERVAWMTLPLPLTPAFAPRRTQNEKLFIATIVEVIIWWLWFEDGFWKDCGLWRSRCLDVMNVWFVCDLQENVVMWVCCSRCENVLCVS